MRNHPFHAEPSEMWQIRRFWRRNTPLQVFSTLFQQLHANFVVQIANHVTANHVTDYACAERDCSLPFYHTFTRDRAGVL